MFVICVLAIAIDFGIPMISEVGVRGKVLKTSKTKYLVDFSKGLEEYKLVGKPSDYSKILINKSECVKN